MRQFSIAAAAAILLTPAPHVRAADGPYIAAGDAVTDLKPCATPMQAIGTTAAFFRAAAGWGFAKYLTAEALYLRAGRFVAGISAGKLD